MSDGFDSTPPDDLLDRLAALGTEPVAPALQSAHLTAMAAVHPRSAWHRFARRAGIVAAFGAGLVVGTTGLASAGALGPLQPIVAKGVEAATPLHVPKGPSEKSGDHGAKTSPDGFHGTARVTDGCVKAENGEYAINHGQYLKQERAKGDDAFAAAKATDCGKPLAGDDESDDSATDDASTSKKPDTAGTNKSVADDHKVARCEDDEDATTDDAKAADSANDAAANAGKPACTPAQPSKAANGSGSDDHGKPDGAGKPDGTGKPDTAGPPSSDGSESDK